MADPLGMEMAPLPTASASRFLATFAIIIIAIIALLFVDAWLARVDRAESRALAAHLYADGRALLLAHRPRDAADRFAAAVATDRGVSAYDLGLAEAMLDDGRPLEAERTLVGVLMRTQTDARANLVMARAQLKQAHFAEARSYYHRAIFGRWETDSLAQRLHARLELIQLLLRQHAQREVLAELLPIQEEAPDSVGLQRVLGHLFIQAGSPSRGIEIFRNVLKRFPDDGDAYTGMGEAALAMGNYRTARADFAVASRLAPHDSTLAAKLRLADTALAFDPLLRGLSHRERAERSRQLLALTLALSTRCAAKAADATALADSASRMLRTTAARRSGEDEGDAFVSLAADLWGSARDSCRTTSVSDAALRLVLDRLSA
jgi:tetratricopeptide (TPR) repeat protein